MFSVDEAESSDHRKKKLIKPRLCERNVCRVNSPSHAYAMQKAKTPGSVFNPRTREKRKKINVEIVSSLEPSEGVQTVSVLELQVATFYKHSFILAKLIMICWYNYHTLMRQCVKSLLSSITLQWHC